MRLLRILYGKYPVWTIEGGDITPDFKTNCRGFAHAGKLMYFISVLTAGELKASNILRAEGGTQVRDNRSGVPNGDGVYFRFVRKKGTVINDISHILTGGVGGAAGVLYYMQNEKAVGKSFTTMSSLDVKYGIPEPGSRDLEEIAKYVKDTPVNKTEIAFYQRVELRDISRIYIKKKEIIGKKEEFYEALYRYTRAEQQGIRRVTPVTVAALKEVLDAAMNTRGYKYEKEEEGTYGVKGEKVWYLYQREGAGIPAVRAPAASTPAASASASSSSSSSASASGASAASTSSASTPAAPLPPTG